ncbi:MAG: hypothetical protein AABZ11_09385 [Nitrospinota bacterium]|jgi:hypothetical protein
MEEKEIICPIHRECKEDVKIIGHLLVEVIHASQQKQKTDEDTDKSIQHLQRK